jgi:hypothetical protein
LATGDREFRECRQYFCIERRSFESDDVDKLCDGGTGIRISFLRVSRGPFTVLGNIRRVAIGRESRFNRLLGYRSGHSTNIHNHAHAVQTALGSLRCVLRLHARGNEHRGASDQNESLHHRTSC